MLFQSDVLMFRFNLSRIVTYRTYDIKPFDHTHVPGFDRGRLHITVSGVIILIGGVSGMTIAP